MQNEKLEEFKLDLLYTLSEVGIHFEIYKQYETVDCYVLSGILMYSIGRQMQEITLQIYLLENFVNITLGNRSGVCTVNAGDLVSNVYSLLI